MRQTNSLAVDDTHGLRNYLGIVGALTLALAVTACNKADDGKTAGQKLDSAIAKTEAAAADAKAKTESSMANAGNAMKDATGKAEESGKNTAAKAGDMADDAAITARLASNFAKDPDLSTIKIDVDTKGGAVTLTGSAPTAAAKEKATTIAKGMKGVSSVDNKLVVKPS
jgi:hyperosmotically inducible periplasmic protein